MKVKVYEARSAGALPSRIIECDSFAYRDSGFILLFRYDQEVAVFGPGFRGYIEIDYDHYDRGS